MSTFSSVSFSALDDNLEGTRDDISNMCVNESHSKTYFIGFDFLIESIFVDDPPAPPVQENDIRTSPKHKFGSNPAKAESG